MIDAAPPAPPHARLDAPTEVVWEPTWKLATHLGPLERDLLRLPALRRLHYVMHGGTCSFATPYVHSRLQHVLGVFALTARFAPDEADVRAAALLHDVGHAPFSHSLEGVPGVDHHRWTERIVREEPVAGLLWDHGLDPGRVLDVAEGRVPSVLKNRSGVLHLDHLDSLVRSGRMRGTLSTPPASILARLEREGEVVTADAEAGETLERLVLEEAALHVEPVDLGGAAVLSDLTTRLLADESLRLDDLPRMVDAELTTRLWEHPATRDEARRLWFEPWRLHLERLDGGAPAPEEGLVASKERLYLDLPRVRGRSAADEAARREDLRSRAAGLVGRYSVSWR